MSRNLSAALEQMRAICHGHYQDFEELVGVVGRINARLERLEEASSGVEQENKGESMAKESEIQAADYRAEASELPAPAGRRRDRVTLEIEHWGPDSASRWDFAYCLRPVYALESVRVVDTHAEAVAESVAWEGARDAYRGRILRLTEEREAAIREREEAQARVAELLAKHKETVAGLTRERDEESSTLREMWRLSREACYERAEERDAAIRERDEAKARVAQLEADLVLRRGVTAADDERLRAAEVRVFGEGVTWGCDAAEHLADEVEFLREQLESVADRAAAAETALKARDDKWQAENAEAFVRLQKRFDDEWNGTAPAASGGNSSAQPYGSQAASGGGEPVAWGVRRSDGTWWESCRSTRDGMLTVTFGGDANNVVSPLFDAPPQPRGWLKEDERACLEKMRDELKRRLVMSLKTVIGQNTNRDLIVIESILARSSPPEQPRGWLSEEQRAMLLSLALGYERRAAQIENMTIPGMTLGSNLPKASDCRSDALMLRDILASTTDTQPRGWLTKEERKCIEGARSLLTGMSAAKDPEKVLLESWVLKAERDRIVSSFDALLARSSPPEQPRGWLTEEERRMLKAAKAYIPGGFRVTGIIDNLLARSTPPEVVLPQEWGNVGKDVVVVKSEVISALAAAGVTVKGVGSE
jgi:hypothetical protein